MVNPSNNNSLPARLSVGLVIAGTAIVTLGQVVTVLLLCRIGRQMASAGLPATFIGMGLPMLVAFASFYWLLRARQVRWMPPWVGAFLLTLLSSWLSILLPLNMYGE